MTLSFAFRLKWVLIAVLITYSLGFVDTCNEAVCASIVSKCIIMDSCNCDLSQCSCCKDCFICLSFLYDECCSCFGLCPKRNAYLSDLSKISLIEELDEPIPQLFEALTDGPDVHQRWTSFRFPIEMTIKPLKPKQNDSGSNRMNADNTHKNLVIVTSNCSIAYMTECTNHEKCKQQCHSMGASSYRWFHDACCECVGDKCPTYGLMESKCSNCPRKEVPKEEENVVYDDYGQDGEYDVDYGHIHKFL